MEITAEHVGKTLARSFAGWMFPDPVRRQGAHRRIVIRQQAKSPGSAHAQISEAITNAGAVEVTPNSSHPLSVLYRGLLNCRDGCVMVRPLVVSVGGDNFSPATYQVQHYYHRTHLMANLLLTCNSMLKARWPAECKSADVSAYAKRDTANAATVAEWIRAEGLIKLSSADSGLKFKDRAATRLLHDTRERCMHMIRASFRDVPNGLPKDARTNR